MSRTRSGIAVVSVGLVALTLALVRDQATPGPLAAVHVREQLGGADGCTSCHADARRDMAGACIECHAPIGTALADSRGLHGGLPPEQARDCASCHAEHEGHDFALVGTVAFQRAGYSDAEAYDHDGLAFGLEGAHASLRCERCHAEAQAAVLPVGSQRFLGLDQTCARCHDDPHEGGYGDGCARCHGQRRPFPEMDGFEHQTYCPLVGAHADVACRTCHPDDGRWSVASLVQRAASPPDAADAARDCEACHRSPHREAFVDQVLASFPDLAEQRGAIALLAAATEGAGPAVEGTACRLCHGAEHGRFGGDATGQAGLWHAATGFPLDAPHDEPGCEACHPGFGTREPLAATILPDAPAREAFDRARFLDDYPGRDADACQACHGDPHEAQFDVGPLAGSVCLDCHERHAFAPSTFDVVRHADTRWPLQGAHATDDCAACHTPVAGAADAEARATRRFADAPEACAACHTNPHRKEFLHGVGGSLALADPTESCATCHDALHETFTGEHGDASASLHAASGFVLEAPHAGLECAACHEGFGQTKLAHAVTSGGGTAGGGAAFAAAFPGRDADSCQACHTDPHDGQFERGAFAGRGCLACHERHAFVPPAFGDAHHAATDFPLDGSHLAVACTTCHRQPEGAARRFVDTPANCDACHDDVHRGRFDGDGKPRVVDGARGCARCHDTTAFDDFSGGRFDHDLWTGWPVRGEHEALECDACHRPRAWPDADGRRFGRAAGTGCADCHGDPHAGQFVQSGATDCTRCHTDAQPFTEPLFDHQRDSRFALDATHAQLECSACHRPAPLPQGGTAVRYRPLGTSCGDCHAPGSVPDLPGDDRR